MDIHEYRSPTSVGRAVDRAVDPASESSPGTASDTTVDAQAPQREVGRRVQLGYIASDREILLRGRRAFERGEDAVALESLSRLAAHGVQFADVHYMIGMLHERSGEIAAALANLRQAIRINPSYVEALLALASLHERRGEFDRSRGYAERASQLARPTAGGLDPTTRGKLANQQADLADALADAGELRDAIEQYRRALDRCPTFHDIRHRLGITLREAGLPAQAAQEFARILRLHPGMLESQIQLGLTYYSMGRTPDAIREWDAVLEKDPSRDEARMYLRLIKGTRRSATIETSWASDVMHGENELSFSAITARPSPEVARSPQDVSRSSQEVERADRHAISGWSSTELVGVDPQESSE